MKCSPALFLLIYASALLVVWLISWRAFAAPEISYQSHREQVMSPLPKLNMAGNFKSEPQQQVRGAKKQ